MIDSFRSETFFVCNELSFNSNLTHTLINAVTNSMAMYTLNAYKFTAERSNILYTSPFLQFKYNWKKNKNARRYSLWKQKCQTFEYFIKIVKMPTVLQLLHFAVRARLYFWDSYLN